MCCKDTVQQHLSTVRMVDLTAAQGANKKPPNKKSRGEAPTTQEFLAWGRPEAQTFLKPVICCLRQAAESQKHLEMSLRVWPEGPERETRSASSLRFALPILLFGRGRSMSRVPKIPIPIHFPAPGKSMGMGILGTLEQGGGRGGESSISSRSLPM